MQLVFFNFLLFFLPFVVLPFEHSPYEIPKVILAMCAINALGVLMLLENRLHFTKILRQLLYILGGIILVSLYHVVTVPTEHMFWGNIFRMQGIVLLWYLLLWSVISSQVSFKRLAYFVYGFVLVALAGSALLLGNATHRAVGTLGEPNALAACVAFFWPFVFFAPDVPESIRKYIQASTILLTTLVVLLSGSRSGLIAFGLQLLLVVAIKLSKKLKVALIIVFVLLLATYFLPFISHTKYEDRAVIWHSALIAGMQHPLLGSGFGNTEIALRKVIVAEHNTLIGYSVDDAHNVILDWWVQSGVAGVGLLIGLVGLTLKRFYRRRDALYLVLLIGVLAVVSFNPASIVTLLQLWWLIGQGFTDKKHTVTKRAGVV